MSVQMTIEVESARSDPESVAAANLRRDPEGHHPCPFCGMSMGARTGSKTIRLDPERGRPVRVSGAPCGNTLFGSYVPCRDVIAAGDADEMLRRYRGRAAREARIAALAAAR